jgi:hypothetical protein
MGEETSTARARPSASSSAVAAGPTRLLEDQADLPAQAVPETRPRARSAGAAAIPGASRRGCESPADSRSALRGIHGRIVEKGAGMQRAHHAARKVLSTAEGINAPSPRPEAERHGVDREVPPGEVLCDRGARGDGRERPGERSFAARGRHVDLPAVAQCERGGPEASVLADRCLEAVDNSRANAIPSPSTTRSTSRTGRPRSRSRTTPPAR